MILVEDHIARFVHSKLPLTSENIDKLLRLLNDAERELRSRALKINPLGECLIPPPGWVCSRDAGHEGPCAAWQQTPRLENIEENVMRNSQAIQELEERVSNIEREREEVRTILREEAERQS